MCLGVFFVAISPGAIAACVIGYCARVFALTAFYHRRFSHRAFDTSRVVQFIFAVVGAAAAQRGPLWWSAHHRHHHKYSDQPQDKHSPHVHGFLWSHCGWFLQDQNFGTDKSMIKDWLKYPELVWLNRFDLVAPLAYGILLFMLGGWSYLIWGYFVSTTLVYHVTFSVNSVAHKVGTRDYATKDQSRNNWWLALLTFGEGWHNNHHYWPSSARQGFTKYQIDISYMILRTLEKFKLVWDLRVPPQEVIQAPLVASYKTQAISS
jgi:stearoyl-CoA desaturase (delta-9 desaturase)